MPTVNVEVPSELTRPSQAGDQDGVARWEEEVAPGETLGRLLARLVWEQPLFEAFFDPGSRRLADQVELLVNGRTYRLIGGLTYTLHDGDRLTVVPRPGG